MFECDLHSSSSIEHRISDLHEAFSHDEVDGILTAIGDFNCNELLPYMDYDLIRQHPKVLCGYSDITALANAITAKCDMVTYSGPHFYSLLFDFNWITHSCPHRKNTSMFYFGSQRSVFKLEGVFYLSHLRGSVPNEVLFCMT